MPLSSQRTDRGAGTTCGRSVDLLLGAGQRVTLDILTFTLQTDPQMSDPTPPTDADAAPPKPDPTATPPEHDVLYGRGRVGLPTPAAVPPPSPAAPASTEDALPTYAEMAHLMPRS
jgi:hypothetical protein